MQTEVPCGGRDWRARGRAKHCKESRHAVRILSRIRWQMEIAREREMETNAHQSEKEFPKVRRLLIIIYFKLQITLRLWGEGAVPGSDPGGIVLLARPSRSSPCSRHFSLNTFILPKEKRRKRSYCSTWKTSTFPSFHHFHGQIIIVIARWGSVATIGLGGLGVCFWFLLHLTLFRVREERGKKRTTTTTP